MGGDTVADVTEPSYLRTTRASYDTVAEDYAVLVGPLFDQEPVGRSMLAAFAELVCGPDQVAMPSSSSTNSALLRQAVLVPSGLVGVRTA